MHVPWLTHLKYINRAIGISRCTNLPLRIWTKCHTKLIYKYRSMTGLPIVCTITIDANPDTASGYLYDFDLVSVASNNSTKIAIITTWNKNNLNTFKKIFQIRY